MQSHAPPGYECPFCRLLRGVETEHNRLDDIVWRDERTTAFISPRWWPNNHGHVLVIPNEHVENLYAIDDELLGAVYATVKRVAIALKTAYGCDGDVDAPAQRARGQPGRLAPARPRLPALSRRPPLRAARGEALGVARRARAVRREAARRSLSDSARTARSAESGSASSQASVFEASLSSASTLSSRCSGFVSSSFVCDRPRRLCTKSITVGMPARETSAASCSGPDGSWCDVPATSRTASSAKPISVSSNRIGSMFQIRSHSTSMFSSAANRSARLARHREHARERVRVEVALVEQLLGGLDDRGDDARPA